MTLRLFAFLLALAAPAAAQTDHAAIADQALNQSILQGFERLAEATRTLEAEAAAACSGEGPVEAAYHRAFDAWIGVEHFRFGPAEEDNARFAIAFWPDTKGATPRTLEAMVAADDPAVDDPAAFAEVSVAARGLFALDYLLFDPEAAPIEAGSYRCRLLVAITRDMAATSARMLARWRDPWAGILTSAGAPENPVYLAPEESSRALYSALTEALQADVDLRLGRPLGTFERPQPRRAEAWRSGRSLRNVEQSLETLRAYAATVFGPSLSPATPRRSTRASPPRSAPSRGCRASRSTSRLPSRRAGSGSRRCSRRSAACRPRSPSTSGPRIGVTSGFNSMDGD